MIAQPKVISSSLCGILGRWIMGGIEEILLIAGGRREKERREREGGRERKRERERLLQYAIVLTFIRSHLCNATVFKNL